MRPSSRDCPPQLMGIVRCGPGYSAGRVTIVGLSIIVICCLSQVYPWSSLWLDLQPEVMRVDHHRPDDWTRRSRQLSQRETFVQRWILQYCDCIDPRRSEVTNNDGSLCHGKRHGFGNQGRLFWHLVGLHCPACHGLWSEWVTQHSMKSPATVFACQFAFWREREQPSQGRRRCLLRQKNRLA